MMWKAGVFLIIVSFVVGGVRATAGMRSVESGGQELDEAVASQLGGLGFEVGLLIAGIFLVGISLIRACFFSGKAKDAQK